MEFPDLGQHCSEQSCRRLDFLPVKCDACGSIFCSTHMSYISHNCASAYKKNVQVPVCPLCNSPVPINRGDLPDIAVSQHIDNDCKSDHAEGRRKIFTNRCSMKRCRAKEIIPVVCGECKKNFCLKHRHTADHNCDGLSGRAAQAAVSRQRNKPIQNNNMLVSSVHGSLSEDEALAKALQLSMAECTSNPSGIRTSHLDTVRQNCSLS